MVKTFQVYLPTKNKCTYSCIHCRAHLADHDDLISKSFQGSQGRAYLFNRVINVTTGPAEERYLLTGLHSVADISCDSCKTTIGWKYEQAFETSQKYKEGKFIVELAHLIKDNGWEDGAVFGAASGSKKGTLYFSSPWSIYSKSSSTKSKTMSTSSSSSSSNKPTTSGLSNHHHGNGHGSHSDDNHSTASSSSASSSHSPSPASSVSGSPTSPNSISGFW